ncbi:hypothetical protein [Lysinibacillus sphaericus]|nr:hypothetical protein [Lysinibacillus sphaericus]
MRKRSVTERQQQMFFVRKRNANVVSATDIFCAKAKCQQKGFNCAKA